MDTLLQDLRYAVRILTRNYGFTIVAILTLALGIGANSAIFSAVNAILLKPLPYREPERLMVVTGVTDKNPQGGLSYLNLIDIRDQNKVFTDITTIVPQSVNLTSQAEPDRVRGGFVHASFFNVIDVKPQLGRTFLPGEDAKGAERVCVVNYQMWQNRYGGDSALIGQSLTLNGEPFTVIGIMPESFRFPIDEIDVWMPIQSYPNFQLTRNSHYYFAIGRLKPGVSVDQANAEMDTLAAQLAQAYPEENRGRRIKLLELKELLIKDLRPGLLILLTTVGLILLIACANIANLLLARGSARQKEIAVRAALGASRWRLLRQLLTETVLLSLVGGLLGLCLALWSVDLLRALLTDQLPSFITFQIDRTVLLYTSLLSVITGLLFGLIPALQLSKPDLNQTLKEGGRNNTEGGRQRLRAVFVVSQVAISMILLIAAGLLIKSFYRLTQVEPGFNSENLLSMEYRLPRNKYAKPESQWQFHRQVVERVQELPGVQSVAVIRGLPFSGNGGSVSFTLPDRATPAKGQEPSALFNQTHPNYFDTIGIPFLQGRNFTNTDSAESNPVVIINKMMAEQYWPNQNALGKQIHFIGTEATATVIGIVGNARQYSLSEDQRPQIYICYSQQPEIFGTLLVRTAVAPMSLANDVRAKLWTVDKDQPVWKIRTMASMIQRDVADKRLIMSLMVVFATVALLLAIIGIYGVISYSVNQRTHEIGIRMALGARPGDILSLILKQGLVLTLIGIILGAAGALMVTRFLASLLFGVSTTDPLIFFIVAGVLLLVTLLAVILPARRAIQVDPMVALRFE